MKFNEKLTELRKKEGLSQEELGYKLNVTRQTVSKWELGQTTPEMDKLVEISKIFNTSVDQLINESENGTNIESEVKSNPTIEQQPIKKADTREKNVKTILIGILIIVVVIIAVRFFTGLGMTNMPNSVDQEAEGFLGKFFGLLDKAIDSQDKANEKTEGLFNGVFDSIDEAIDSQENKRKEMEIDSFNRTFEIYLGTKMGASAKRVLDNVITNNKKEERKITVKYLETETQNPEEIKNMKAGIDDFKNYEISFEYDAEGYIYEVEIERL